MTYPHHLVGAPAGPPELVDRRVLGMALKAHARHLAGVEEAHEQLAAAGYRRAYALDELVAEANAADPARNKASDGWIGDARHQAEGTGSQHNPNAAGVVCAQDITNDPALNLAAVAERIRLAAVAGRLPQVTGGGYVIFSGRITNEDFSGWHVYTGTDPHVSHMHVSTSANAAQYDLRAAWGVFTSEQPPAPAPPPAPAGWTGPDLTGHGAGLRGQAAGQPQGPQSNGPRVKRLQQWLFDNYHLYAANIGAIDGWYGPKTAAVLAEFARRSNIAGADGLNIGPKLAAALTRAGFEQTSAAPPPYSAIGAPPRSTAREKVLRHLARRDSR